MKKLISILFILISFACYSQEFIGNPAYKYGMGNSDDEALVSLAKTIRASVSSESSHSVYESGKKFGETYSSESKVISSVELRGESLPAKIKGKWYRYINKEEFIDARKRIVMEYLSLADSLRGSGKKHEQNLILGCYYLAYRAIDSDVMDALYDKNIDTKEYIIRMARESYKLNYAEYGYLAISYSVPSISKTYVSVGAGRLDGYLCQPAPLFGFEYYENGIWKTPNFFMKKVFNLDEGISNVDSDMEIHRSCAINGIKTQFSYRLLHEEYDNGRYIKLNVPDWWYFDSYSCSNK